MAQRQETTRLTDQDISSTGTILVTGTPGDVLVSLNITATADASYALDVSPGGDTWFEAEETYDQADVADPQDIRDTFYIGDAKLRIRVTDAAGAGETADVSVQEAR